MANEPSPPTSPWSGISPGRLAFDLAARRFVFTRLGWAADHWLLLINSASFAALVLPTVFAPLFLAWGWNGAAQAIFDVFKLTCHQMPSRSFFLFGEQMAYCERNVGIFGSFFLFGMAYVLMRRRLRSLPIWLTAVYMLPMAIDGFTQLFGWRESTWELRVVTGSFFGLAVVWYTFPHFDLYMRLQSWQFRQELALGTEKAARQYAQRL